VSQAPVTPAQPSVHGVGAPLEKTTLATLRVLAAVPVPVGLQDLHAKAVAALAPSESGSTDCGGTESVPSISEEDVTSTCSSQKVPADLSGTWVLDRVEGDFEALMADAGVPWAIRKLAKGAGYGAGMVRHVIRHEGDWLDVIFNVRPGKTEHMRVKMGLEEQSTANEDGTPIVVHPRWEGDALVVTGKGQDGSPMQATRRYMADQELVCESQTSTGVAVKRFFTRV